MPVPGVWCLVPLPLPRLPYLLVMRFWLGKVRGRHRRRLSETLIVEKITYKLHA